MSSSKDNSLISVVIPVYNCESYLADAIKSVLAQDYRPIEIIVVNDGSTDRSEQVAEEFSENVRYFYRKNGGVGAARNKGIDLATGAFFAFLDADDLWLEDKLKRQVAAFDCDASLDIVFGHVQQFISPELPERVKKSIICSTSPMPGRIPSAILIKRESFFRVGYFDQFKGDALDWNLRAVELDLKNKMLSEVVLKRRLHKANDTLLHSKDTRADYLRAIKASLDRRRKGKTNGIL